MSSVTRQTRPPAISSSPSSAQFRAAQFTYPEVRHRMAFHRRGDPPMLTPEELAKLEGAETLFPSPIPVQFVSSDEFMPAPQTAQQKEFEARIKETGAQLARKHGMTRRNFFKTAGGMAAAFAALNEVYAKNSQPVYEVLKGETTSLDVAQQRTDALKNQFVMDMHTHFLREGTPITAFVAQRTAVGKAGWNPALKDKPQTIQDLMFPNYVKEIFLDSETKVDCISGSYSEEPNISFLPN